MKKFRILTGLLLIIICISFQSRAADRIDSLRQVINSHPVDRQTVDNLLVLTQAFIDQYKSDSASRYARQALVLSTSLKYYDGIAESHYKFYLIENKRGNYQDALNYIRVFNNLCSQNGDETRLGKGYFSYGVLLEKQGKTDSSIYYIQKSLVINLNLNDTARLIATNNALGNIYLNLSDYDSAASYYLKAAQLAEASGRLNYLGPIYNNLGKTFTCIKDYEKAGHYLDIAFKINEKNKDYKTMVENLQNLASNYLLWGYPEKALSYLDSAAEIRITLDNDIETANLYNNYASVYQRQEKYDLALENYQKALPLFRKQNYTEGISMALKNIGEMYIEMDKYEMAQAMLDSALQLATSAGYLQNRRLILQDLAFNYSYSGNFKKAFEYHVMYFQLYDSLLNLDKLKATKELEKKYQKEKDQATILTLEKANLQKTIQRNFILYIAIGSFMLMVFIVLYFRQKAVKDQIIAQQRIRHLEEEKRLMTARLLLEGQEEERKRVAQELHDGLGVLLSATKMHFTTIRDLGPENQPLVERATQLLEQASGDVRRISHNMMPGSLTKLGLFEALEDLVDNIDGMQGIHATIEISGDMTRLPENKEIMLYRVVQEMVNNTLKHAQAKNISLKINRSANELELNYSDDGIGLDTEIMLVSTSSSLGLKGIQSRIGFLGGEVKIDSSPGNGVKYMIRVPIL